MRLGTFVFQLPAFFFPPLYPPPVLFHIFRALYPAENSDFAKSKVSKNSRLSWCLTVNTLCPLLPPLPPSLPGSFSPSYLYSTLFSTTSSPSSLPRSLPPSPRPPTRFLAVLGSRPPCLTSRLMCVCFGVCFPCLRSVCVCVRARARDRASVRPANVCACVLQQSRRGFLSCVCLSPQAS